MNPIKVSVDLRGPSCLTGNINAFHMCSAREKLGLDYVKVRRDGSRTEELKSRNWKKRSHERKDAAGNTATEKEIKLEEWVLEKTSQKDRGGQFEEIKGVGGSRNLGQQEWWTSTVTEKKKKTASDWEQWKLIGGSSLQSVDGLCSLECCCCVTLCQDMHTMYIYTHTCTLQGNNL